MEHHDRLVEVRCSLQPRGRSSKGGGATVVVVTPPPSMAPALLDRDKLPRITHTMAQALVFEDSLARGEATDHADLARLGAISRERVSQVMKMLWLAPDIQEEILRLPPVRRGDYPITIPEVAAISDEVLWEEQRSLWSKLKQKRDLPESAEIA